MKQKYLLLIVLIIVISLGCKKRKHRVWNVNVDTIQVNLKIKRYELDLFTIPIDSFYKEIPRLQKEYGDFFNLYNTQLIGIGMPTERNFYQGLRRFMEYCNTLDLYNEVLKVFPPQDDFIRNSLTKAFKYYKYYFPDRKIPDIYTCISGFQVSVFTTSDYVGISLDKYLGSNYEIYSQMFEKYLRRRMFKQMLPIDVMRAWLIAEFPYNDTVHRNLLTNMIYQGRIQYALDAIFPNTPDTLKWGYTYPQWAWANMYEKNIWDYLVDRKLLFSDSSIDIKIFTGEAPFTTAFHNNSAPRSGTFIGYKIVQSYMDRHPEVSLKELMECNDYMKIYNESYYNP